MDELVRQISSRVGISEQQARQAVDVVLDFTKDRLPEPFAKHIENALTRGGDAGGGDGGIVGQVQDQLGNLGGLFGKRD